jgi:hypothetical protein
VSLDHKQDQQKRSDLGHSTRPRKLFKVLNCRYRNMKYGILFFWVNVEGALMLVAGASCNMPYMCFFHLGYSSLSLSLLLLLLLLLFFFLIIIIIIIIIIILISFLICLHKREIWTNDFRFTSLGVVLADWTTYWEQNN